MLHVLNALHVLMTLCLLSLNLIISPLHVDCLPLKSMSTLIAGPAKGAWVHPEVAEEGCRRREHSLSLHWHGVHDILLAC